MIAYTINFNSVIEMTDEQFYQLCRTNPEVKFERNATGELTIMPGNVLDMGMGCPESLVGLNPAIQIPMSSALPYAAYRWRNRTIERRVDHRFCDLESTNSIG